MNLKFETKVLDIAYLLMLKLMKEPGFRLDKKFVMLHIKILTKQGKFKDAIDFIERNSDFFNDKMQKNLTEANLYLLSANHILTINLYFNILRINSHINQFVDLWPQYKTCISIICDDFLPKKKKFDLKKHLTSLLSKDEQSLHGDAPSIEAYVLKQDTKGVNFDPITIEAEPLDVLINLIASIKNLRKDIVIDSTSKRVIAIANEMRRTSFLADLEYKYVLALNYTWYPVSDTSSFF